MALTTGQRRISPNIDITTRKLIRAGKNHVVIMADQMVILLMITNSVSRDNMPAIRLSIGRDVPPCGHFFGGAVSRPVGVGSAAFGGVVASPD